MISENNHEVKGYKGGVPVIFVVIPSHNSGIYIRQYLRAIRSQSTELPFEMTVVDSSSDGTHQIIAQEFTEAMLFHFLDGNAIRTFRNRVKDF